MYVRLVYIVITGEIFRLNISFFVYNDLSVTYEYKLNPTLSSSYPSQFPTHGAKYVRITVPAPVWCN